MEDGDEEKGLRVNMGKTNILVSGINEDVQMKTEKDLCGVCQTGEGRNAIFCGGCKRWVHKKCSGIKGPLRADPEFRCARCLGTALVIDGIEETEVEVGNKKLEVIPEFCYIGNMLTAGGGCDHTLQMCMGQVPPIATSSQQPSAPFWSEVRCTQHTRV